jgi:hypothetical protein
VAAFEVLGGVPFDKIRLTTCARRCTGSCSGATAPSPGAGSRSGRTTAALDIALARWPNASLAGAGGWRVAGTRSGIEVRAAIGARFSTAVQRLTRVEAGSAVLAARLAVAVSGFRPFTALFPDPQHPGVLAVLRCGGTEPCRPAGRIRA